MKSRFIYYYPSFFLLLLFISCRTSTGSLDSAILNNDWKQVYALLKADSANNSAVRALLLGHAAMLTNQGNESYAYLRFALNSAADSAAWKSWADSFANSHSGSASARYLLGDARMRTGDTTGAVSCFNEAINIDKGFSPAYNARASVCILQGQWENAMNDLNKAIDLDSSVAGYFLNRATMHYLKKNPEGALKDFKKAAALDTSYALAINGLACSDFFAVPQDADPKKPVDINLLLKKLDLASQKQALPLFRWNARAIVQQFEDQILPGDKSSPFFRPSDFINWEILQKLTTEQNDILRLLLGGPLPAEIEPGILKKLNDLLVIKDFKTKLAGHPALSDSVAKLETVISKLQLAANAESALKIQIKNRLLLEALYSGLIEHYRRDVPGTQFVMRQGLVNSYDLIKGLPHEERDRTYDRVRVYYRVSEFVNGVVSGAQGLLTRLGAKDPRILVATAFVSGGVKAWNSMLKDRLTTFEKVNNDLGRHPGGVLADVKKRLIDSNEPYPFICPLGLAYDQH